MAVKITVLKRELYKDLVDEYAADKNFSPCAKFKDGQEFILNAKEMPAGF